MSAVRKNTLVVDFSVLPERPKLDHVQRFVKKVLGLDSRDFRSIQLHNIRHCVLIEMADPAAAIKTANDHHLKHVFRVNLVTKIAIPVYVDDNTVDVRVHDLPPDMPNNLIAEAMREYGEVLTIRDEVWKNFFTGVPNGVRVLKMKLSKPVPSYVTISKHCSLATHPEQIATCRRCGLKRHVGKSCSEVAKKQQQTKPTIIQPIPFVSPLADPIVAESQIITPNIDESDDEGFTTVGRRGKTKRQLQEEEKKESDEKRTCLDDDDKTTDSGNEQRNEEGKKTKPQMPKRRIWKPTLT